MNGETTRLIAFISVALTMTAFETLWPARPHAGKTTVRWLHHMGLLLTGITFIRIIMPLGIAGIAVLATQNNWGLFNLLQWPLWIKITLSVIILDLAIYVQHYFFHQQPWLWSLHRVHHTDTHLDTSTGIRFHPIELIISLLYKVMIILILGIPVEAALIFEVSLNVFSLWSHANIHLHPVWDYATRKALVTPNMHRIHHSIEPQETHKNFGFCLSIWDRLFNTYKKSFTSPNPTLGLPDHRSIKDQQIHMLLKQPFDRYFFKR